MTKFILCCVSILALVTTAAPARAAERADCASRILKLEASEAEGAERLAEKNDAVDHCDSQYKRDKTIQRLVNECAKYLEQPVIKQLLVSECQIAAFKYANALKLLKAEYRK
jgi:hypothetical protein